MMHEEDTSGTAQSLVMCLDLGGPSQAGHTGSPAALRS